MSSYSKKPIQMPENVEISLEEGNTVSVKGPKGEIKKVMPKEMGFETKEGELWVKSEVQEKASKAREREKALLGTWHSLIANMVKGVTEGFEETLQIKGVGWRAEMNQNNLVLHVGFSHPVTYSPDEEVNIDIEEGEIKIRGIDKEKVGQAAAEIRKVQPPEPYKGKGIRYKDEEVLRKASKKAGGTE